LANPERWGTSKPLLAVDAVASGYGRVKVLHGVSLELYAGEVVCIIGPNGAGKTTLLRTVSGLCRPTAGRITFKGEPVQGMRPHHMARRGLGHCPEGRRVFQHLSIEENLVAGYLSGRGRGRAELFDEVYGLFPILRERRAQPASRLSGGQQQMLAIGRALMGDPELLLLDEPSLGLAPIVIHQIFEIVIKLVERGVSVVLVEQNVDLSFEIADYVYAFDHGGVHCSGPAEKLRGDERVRDMYLPQVH
jgi:branched-chain amino acid transport system ATP-binding protein